jgi:Zn-dependent protease with chaperone function
MNKQKPSLFLWWTAGLGGLLRGRRPDCHSAGRLVTKAVLIIWVIIHFVAAGLLMVLANWSGAISWRRAAGAHWTERARLLWPVRFTAGLNVFLIPALLNQAHWVFFPIPEPAWLINGLAAFLGALLGCYPFEHEMFPQLDFKKWRHQLVAGWGIRFGIWGLFIAGILLMPETAGVKMAAVTLAYLLLHFAIQWGFLLHYLRWVKFVCPAGERLQRLVAEAARKMNVTPRATSQMAGPYAAAFAFPTTRELLFSDRLLEICTDEEILGITCHELAHLSESKIVLAGRLLGSLALFPLLFLIPCVHHFDWPGLFLPYLPVLIISLASRALSQRMEKRADQIAAGAQLHEGVYARALEKIYRENQIPAVNVNNRQTHPHLFDRMVAAGVSPDYPRPARPRRLTLMGWCFGLAFAGLVVLSAFLE